MLSKVNETLLAYKQRDPTIGNGVLIGGGAKAPGSFAVVGDARIAANAVVLREVPKDAAVTGIPARVVRLAGRKVDDLDQLNIPDPVAQELEKLRERVTALERACPRSTVPIENDPEA